MRDGELGIMFEVVEAWLYVIDWAASFQQCHSYNEVPLYRWDYRFDNHRRSWQNAKYFCRDVVAVHGSHQPPDQPREQQECISQTRDLVPELGWQHKEQKAVLSTRLPHVTRLLPKRTAAVSQWLKVMWPENVHHATMQQFACGFRESPWKCTAILRPCLSKNAELLALSSVGVVFFPPRTVSTDADVANQQPDKVVAQILRIYYVRVEWSVSDSMTSIHEHNGITYRASLQEYIAPSAIRTPASNTEVERFCGPARAPSWLPDSARL